MGARYASWVEGLNADWRVSRQRFFGVPFPVWYRLDDEGVPDHEHPLVPDEDRAAGRPAGRRARRATRRSSAASPEGSSAIPT